MQMRAEIRFGAKTIVTSLSRDILCDPRKIVSYIQSIYVLHWIYNKDQAV